jgi:acyl-CoA hydrolase
MTRPSRPVRESMHETSALMMPGDSNNLGHVFGGVILSHMDKSAAVSALRHARNPVVTVSIDRVDFREPIHVGDLVILKTAVNYVGTSSIEVGVRVEAEDLVTGARRHTNTAYLTFVAIDRNGKPVPVPALIAETDEERKRMADGAERRRRRLEDMTGEHVAKPQA